MTAEPIRPTTPEQRNALKSALRRALKLAGGAASVQHATRVGEADLSRYGSIDHADRHCPIDVAVDLCLEAGHPVILEAMAEICGYRLVRQEGEAGAAHDPLRAVAAIAAETAGLVGAIAAADSDGHRSEAEQRAIDGEAEDAVAAIRRAQRPEGRER